jgi:hypothetical protein
VYHRARVRLEGLGKLRNPMTSSGINPVTFQLVLWANCLENVGASTSHKNMSLQGLLQGQLSSQSSRLSIYVLQYVFCACFSPHIGRFATDSGRGNRVRNWRKNYAVATTAAFSPSDFWSIYLVCCLHRFGTDSTICVKWRTAFYSQWTT